MFPHLSHLVLLSTPDALYDLHLKLILLSHDQLAGPTEWNKLPVFIRKSSSLPLFKTNLNLRLIYLNCVMIRHIFCTALLCKNCLFRRAINDSLIIVIIIIINATKRAVTKDLLLKRPIDYQLYFIVLY